MRQSGVFFILLGVLSLTSMAHAVPLTTSASGTDRGASVELSTWEDVIVGDVQSRCEISIEGTDEEIPFTDGDRVIISVYEDDILGDDLVWQEEFFVSTAELNAGLVSRTFNCASDFGSDQFNEITIYGHVTFIKEECGFFCSNETAQTSNIPLNEVDDDDAEEDDTPSAAVLIEAGQRFDFINRDEDWLEVEVELGAVDLRLLVSHLPEFGRLDVGIFDEFETRVADAEDFDGGALLSVDALPVGTYFIRIAPRHEDDFNFYDTQLIIDLASDACTPGDEERLDCGNCGSTVRTCGNDGRWGDFDGCSGEGPCAPGEGRTTACGNCGSIPEVCNDSCQWALDGECSGEGECSRGDSDRRECVGGFEFRTCDDNCQWGDFGDCVGEECEDGEVRECYNGPDGTEDVGVCHGGRQICDNGRFGQCVGEILPFDERCNDTRDNDCDGLTDDRDPDCAEEGAGLGSACRLSSECAGDQTCLINQFTNGYCSLENCNSDADCGDLGVCGSVFGMRTCLLSCQSDVTCRTSYLCADVGASTTACIPSCNADADCTDPAKPLCDPTGLCTDMIDANNDPRPDPNPDPQPDGMPDAQPDAQPAPQPPPSSGDDGCATTGTPMGGALWPVLGLLIGLGVVRRRL